MRKVLLAIILCMPIVSFGKSAKKVEVVQVKDNKEDELRKYKEYLLCLEQQSKFQIALQNKVSQCSIDSDKVRQCVARVRDRQSSNTGKGALIGLGAAVLTGGASLLFTGAGALIGHQVSDEATNECGNLPNCEVGYLESIVSKEIGIIKRICQPI